MNTSITLYRCVITLSLVLCSVLSARSILHFFQLESYQFPGYFRTLARNPVHSLMPGVLAVAACFVIFILYDFIAMHDKASSVAQWICAVFVPLLAASAGLAISKAFSHKKAKKKLVFTGRMKRLITVLLIVMALSAWFFAAVRTPAVPALLPLLLPLIVALAGLLAWPIEKAISEVYFRDARRKLLQNLRLVRIGITGSYGKTSVKHILGTILDEKYPTLITPASFNTPMGVSRAIRERLEPSHQIFVGEMGARHMGDIKEMCRLVKPTIGIITSVGPQHLETFKTVERIAKTKYELIEALPYTGSHAYFFDDDAYVSDMYNRTQKQKTLCSLKADNADCYCGNVRVSSEGSTFTLYIKDKGEIECKTRLLGWHNIQNIILASAVASDLGLSLRQISHGISKLKPVKHRMELLRNPGGFTIINDAFNSNPVSAKAALEVFREFPKRRIIITPGMVELGQREAEYNKEFGKQMAECVDIAIIVGKGRAMPIIEGLREAGFPEDAIHRVDSLDASTELLHKIVKPEDTVLYENDLPDHYQEA